MLKNKIVVVTGGGSGIGKSIVKLFSENNAIVCVTDKNLESAEKTAEECVNKSLFYKLDVTNKSEIQKVFKTINNTIGNYSILISNAGVSTMNYVEDLSEEEWDFNMDVHAKGTISGLGLNSTIYDLWIGFLEAVSFGFKHHLDILYENNLPINNVFASDGGFRSRLWMQITSNILQKPIKIYKNIEGSSLGASFLAAKSVNLYRDWNEISNLLGESNTVIPQKKLKKHYYNKYKIYLSLYKNLKNIFPAFDEIN